MAVPRNKVPRRDWCFGGEETDVSTNCQVLGNNLPTGTFRRKTKLFSVIAQTLTLTLTGQGCQSCSWSAEQGKWIFPCLRSRLSFWSRDMVSEVPSRVSLVIPILRLNPVLTCGIPPDFCGGVHLFIGMPQADPWPDNRLEASHIADARTALGCSSSGPQG